MAVIVLEMKVHCPYRALLLQCLAECNTPYTISYEERKPKGIYTLCQVTINFVETNYAGLQPIITTIRRWAKSHRFTYNIIIVNCAINERKVWEHGF